MGMNIDIYFIKRVYHVSTRSSMYFVHIIVYGYESFAYPETTAHRYTQFNVGFIGSRFLNALTVNQ